jgi:hypothetical protein
MPDRPDVFFLPVTEPWQYSALGYVWGKFIPKPEAETNGRVEGKLRLKEKIKLTARMGRHLWSKLQQSGSGEEEGFYLWRVYFRTSREGKLTHLDLLQFFTGEGDEAEQFRIRGLIDELPPEKVVVRLERQSPSKTGEKPPAPAVKPFWLTLQGNLPEAARVGQFWELMCVRRGLELEMEAASLVAESLAAAAEEKSEEQCQTNYESESSGSVKSVIEGKQPEMTVKFSERPMLPEQGKKVTLEVRGEGGIVVRAELNRKTLAKHVEKMDSYADWVGALSGKVAKISAEGIVELETAGVQVFEKKAKVVPPEESAEAPAN